MIGGKNSGLLMAMRIPIRARLLTTMASVRGHLESYPNFRLDRHGTVLKYGLLGYEKSGFFYNLELSREGIILELLSNDSPLYSLRTSLNVAIGVCAVLKDHYEVYLSGIYHYISYELNREQSDYLTSNLTDGQESSNTDIILAKRINGLLRKNVLLESNLLKTENYVSILVSKILVFEGLHRIAAMADLASKYGIRKEDLDSAADRLSHEGYKLIRKGNGKFSVVGI